MAPETLNDTDAAAHPRPVPGASRELDEVIDQATRLLSGLSRNVAIAIAPARDSHASSTSNCSGSRRGPA